MIKTWFQKKQLPIPEKGIWVQLTELPNPKNHPFSKNIFIRTRGIVKEVYPHGFDLSINGDGGTLIIDRPFSYIELNKYKHPQKGEILKWGEYIVEVSKIKIRDKVAKIKPFYSGEQFPKYKTMPFQYFWVDFNEIGY